MTKKVNFLFEIKDKNVQVTQRLEEEGNQTRDLCFRRQALSPFANTAAVALDRENCFVMPISSSQESCGREKFVAPYLRKIIFKKLPQLNMCKVERIR